MSDALRDRIAAARRRANQGTSPSSFLSFITPRKGGLSQINEIAPIEPVLFGDQLHWVRDASRLCMGRIGNEGKMCLLPHDKCNTVTHGINKCQFPVGPFLTIATGSDRGSENATLTTTQLDNDLIHELLNKTDVDDWNKQFAILEAGRARTVTKWEDANDLIQSVVKHSSFTTPSKRNAAADLLTQIESLTDLTMLLQQLGKAEYDDQGIRTNPIETKFESDAYEALMKDVFDRLELLTDVASTVTTVIGNQQETLNLQTKPLEDLLEGLRLDFLSTKATLGTRNMKNPDLPVSLWEAASLAIESCTTISQTLLQTNHALEDTRESVDCLLLEMKVDDDSRRAKPKEKSTHTVGKTILFNCFNCPATPGSWPGTPLLSFKGTAAIAPTAGTAPLEISTALHIYISSF